MAEIQELNELMDMLSMGKNEMKMNEKKKINELHNKLDNDISVLFETMNINDRRNVYQTVNKARNRLFKKVYKKTGKKTEKLTEKQINHIFETMDVINEEITEDEQITEDDFDFW